MSVSGFFRSLSAKVSQSFEEIKQKSEEAGSDIARGMREITSGVERVLISSDQDAIIFEGINEEAGMVLAQYYSERLGAIHHNNKLIISKGETVASQLESVSARIYSQNESITALIKQCGTIPHLKSDVEAINERVKQTLTKLEEVESKLDDLWEETVISQISVWKQEKEASMASYRKQKQVELSRIEKSTAAEREAKIAGKRAKVLQKSAAHENAALDAETELQKKLEEEIKKNMDDYLIYGFSAKPAPVSPTPIPSLESVTLPNEASSELNEFLGDDVIIPTTLQEDEEDDQNEIKVDTTTESP